MLHEKAIRRGAALTALLALAVAGVSTTTAAGTPSSRAQSPSEAAPAASGGTSAGPITNWPQTYAGQTITLETYADSPEMDFYKTQMADFTAKTGINVNYVQLPVDTMDQKIPLQLSAKDSSLDVFFTGSEKISAFVGSGGVEPLDSYIQDPTKTDPAYGLRRHRARHRGGLPAGWRYVLHRHPHGRRRPVLQRRHVPGGRHHGSAE